MIINTLSGKFGKFRQRILMLEGPLKWKKVYLDQFYSHAYLNTRETLTHGNQPNAFWEVIWTQGKQPILNKVACE